MAALLGGGANGHFDVLVGGWAQGGVEQAGMSFDVDWPLGTDGVIGLGCLIRSTCEAWRATEQRRRVRFRGPGSRSSFAWTPASALRFRFPIGTGSDRSSGSMERVLRHLARRGIAACPAEALQLGTAISDVLLSRSVGLAADLIVAGDTIIPSCARPCRVASAGNCFST
jgi:hypothetical protein